MSASQEKRRRREEREEGAEQRRLEQKKSEAKRKRNKVLTAVASILVVVAIIAVILLNTNLFYTRVSAVRIGDEGYTVAEFNYYYFNAYYEMASTYGDYLSYFGINTSLPLEDQAYSDDMSWADYFTDVAITNMKTTQMLCDEAEANGFTLPEEYKDDVAQNLSTMSNTAESYGYTSLDQYLGVVYGRGTDLETVTELMNRDVLASAYSEYIYDSFEYTGDELEEYYQENADSYDYLSYIYYYCSGSADEEAGIDEATAMADAEALVNDIIEGVADEEAFKARVLELTGEEVEASRTRGSSVSTVYSEYILSPDRQYGDTEVIESDSGWYAIMFLGRDDNHYNMVSVRHILIEAEASEDGTYTDEAKEAALERIEEIKEEYEAGDMTEESFAALAEQYSADGGSNTNGGLYENIYKNQMVEEFNDFCFDEDRQPGDTGIVYGETTSYAGYHLIYFVGEEEQMYSEYLADIDMRNRDYSAWEEAALEKYEDSRTFAMIFAG